MQVDPLVSIRCLVYNHEPFLRQCLDGFVMQQTTFPFEAIVHDDASTDGSAAIIREYAEKYPDIIKPIYETENLYSKHDGSLARVMDEAIHPSSKYVALCEGDDYWTDPHKLQIQVDFLESHPEYSMCCHATKFFSQQKQEFVGKDPYHGGTGDLPVDYIVLNGGWSITTCSLLYRKQVKDNYPQYCRKCHVGDYPLQIMCAMKGKVYYFDKPMAVYRTEVPNSWESRQRKIVFDKFLKSRKTEIDMLNSFAQDYPRYKKLFKTRVASFLNANLPKEAENKARYLVLFDDEIKKYNWFWKLNLHMKLSDNRYERGLYYRVMWRCSKYRKFI